MLPELSPCAFFGTIQNIIFYAFIKELRNSKKWMYKKKEKCMLDGFKYKSNK